LMSNVMPWPGNNVSECIPNKTKRNTPAELLRQ
jgi:hypothetical protein